MNSFRQDNTYIEYEDSDSDTIIYVKTINNIVTNEYYVFDATNQRVYKSRDSVDYTEDIKLFNKKRGFPDQNVLEIEIGGLVFSRQNVAHSADMLLRINGVVTPVKMQQIVYKSDNGFSYLDEQYINLLDGSFLTFEEIDKAFK